MVVNKRSEPHLSDRDDATVHHSMALEAAAHDMYSKYTPGVNHMNAFKHSDFYLQTQENNHPQLSPAGELPGSMPQEIPLIATRHHRGTADLYPQRGGPITNTTASSHGGYNRNNHPDQPYSKYGGSNGSSDAYHLPYYGRGSQSGSLEFGSTNGRYNSTSTTAHHPTSQGYPGGYTIPGHGAHHPQGSYNERSSEGVYESSSLHGNSQTSLPPQQQQYQSLSQRPEYQTPEQQRLLNQQQQQQQQNYHQQPPSSANHRPTYHREANDESVYSGPGIPPDSSNPPPYVRPDSVNPSLAANQKTPYTNAPEGHSASLADRVPDFNQAAYDRVRQRLDFVNTSQSHSSSLSAVNQRNQEDQQQRRAEEVAQRILSPYKKQLNKPEIEFPVTQEQSKASPVAPPRASPVQAPPSHVPMPDMPSTLEQLITSEPVGRKTTSPPQEVSPVTHDESMDTPSATEPGLTEGNLETPYEEMPEEQPQNMSPRRAGDFEADMEEDELLKARVKAAEDFMIQDEDLEDSATESKQEEAKVVLLDDDDNTSVKSDDTDINEPLQQQHRTSPGSDRSDRSFDMMPRLEPIQEEKDEDGRTENFNDEPRNNEESKSPAAGEQYESISGDGSSPPDRYEMSLSPTNKGSGTPERPRSAEELRHRHSFDLGQIGRRYLDNRPGFSPLKHRLLSSAMASDYRAKSPPPRDDKSVSNDREHDQDQEDQQDQQDDRPLDIRPLSRTPSPARPDADYPPDSRSSYADEAESMSRERREMEYDFDAEADHMDRRRCQSDASQYRSSPMMAKARARAFGFGDGMHGPRSPPPGAMSHLFPFGPPMGTSPMFRTPERIQRPGGKNDVFFCHLCSFVGTSKVGFQDHMNGHFEHSCPYCDYTSRTEGRLKRHIKDFHSDDPPRFLDEMRTPRQKVFKCKQCDYVTNVKTDFWEHSRQHIKDDKVLACPKCPFVTEYKHHLEYHLRNHFGSKPFKCGKCNYSCVNKSMLNSHMKSHTNVYQYRCSDCTYATKYCHSLKLHLKKYGHKPAVVLNSDGSLPVDGSGDFDLVSKRGPPRGPRAQRGPNGKEPQSPGFPSPGPLPAAPALSGVPNSMVMPGMNGKSPLTNNNLFGPPLWPMMSPMGGPPGIPGLPGFPPMPFPLAPDGKLFDSPLKNLIESPLKGMGLPQLNPPGDKHTESHDRLHEAATSPPQTHRCFMCEFTAESRALLGEHMLKAHVGTDNRDLYNMFNMQSGGLPERPRDLSDHRDAPVDRRRSMSPYGERPSSPDPSVKQEQQSPRRASPLEQPAYPHLMHDSHNQFSKLSSEPHEGPEKDTPSKYFNRSIAQQMANDIARESRDTNGVVRDEHALDLTKSLGEIGSAYPGHLPPGSHNHLVDEMRERSYMHSSGVKRRLSPEMESVASTDQSNPSPPESQEMEKSSRKRSRKGKAYKLDTLCMKLQESNNGALTDGEGETEEEYMNGRNGVQYHRENGMDSGSSGSLDEPSPSDRALDNHHTRIRPTNGDAENHRPLDTHGEPRLPNDVDEKMADEQTRTTLNELLSKRGTQTNGVKPEFPESQHTPRRSSDGDIDTLHREARFSPGEEGRAAALEDKFDVPIENGLSKFECAHCGIMFRDCIMYTMHMGYHGYKDAFKCNMCGHQSANRVDFFLHIARVAHE